MFQETFALLRSLRCPEQEGRVEASSIQRGHCEDFNDCTVPEGLVSPTLQGKDELRQLRVNIFLVPARRMKQIEILTNLLTIIGGNIFVGYHLSRWEEAVEVRGMVELVQRARPHGR